MLFFWTFQNGFLFLNQIKWYISTSLENGQIYGDMKPSETELKILFIHFNTSNWRRNKTVENYQSKFARNSTEILVFKHTLYIAFFFSARPIKDARKAWWTAKMLFKSFDVQHSKMIFFYDFYFNIWTTMSRQEI